jgi:hypothetical protein
LSDGELAGGEGGEVAGEDGEVGLVIGDGELADAFGSALLVHAPRNSANAMVPQISAVFAALALIFSDSLPGITPEISGTR